MSANTEVITLTIDFHVHCFAPKIAEKAISQLKERAELEPLTDGLIETTVARFDEWGIDRGVLLSVATRPTQVKVINDWCAENSSPPGSTVPGILQARTLEWVAISFFNAGK